MLSPLPTPQIPPCATATSDYESHKSKAEQNKAEELTKMKKEYLKKNKKKLFFFPWWVLSIHGIRTSTSLQNRAPYPLDQESSSFSSMLTLKVLPTLSFITWPICPPPPPVHKALHTNVFCRSGSRKKNFIIVFLIFGFVLFAFRFYFEILNIWQQSYTNSKCELEFY